MNKYLQRNNYKNIKFRTPKSGHILLPGWHSLCLYINGVRQALKGPSCFADHTLLMMAAKQSQSFLLKNVWAALVQKVRYFLK